MNMLAQIQNDNNTDQVTMVSLELVDYINDSRKFDERPVQLRHADFMAKVPKVLGLETSEKFRSSYLAGNGEQRPCYRSPKREACLMAMSYSYELQAQVFDRMTAMEEALKKPVITLPNFADPAEAAIAWANEYKAKQQALADAEYFKATKAEIGSRREATAMGRLSAKVKEVESLKVQLDKSMDFASIKAVEIATGRKFGWHSLKKWSKANSSEIKTIPDPNFGEVKTYHKDAWLAVYNINLSSIRGA